MTTVFTDRTIGDPVSSHLEPGLSKPSAKKRLIRKKEEEPPLPRPFKLPVNYPRAIKEGLSNGCLSGSSRTKFVSAVAVSMFNHKSYPTKEEYNHVAEQIVQAYPFMRLGCGAGHVS